MATGRIGTTPVLTTRWSKAPSAGTTSLSGLDDNSVSLVYSVGYEAVYQNGVLLSRGNDYTATNGTTITLTTATVAGDIIEVFANQTIPLTDTYSQTVSDGRFIKNTLTTTTGDIIYASAANTPARLGIGSAGQVLTVSSGVPAWATASAPSFVGCLAEGDYNASSGAYTAFTFANEQYDTDGFHSTSSNTSRITIPSGKAGYYTITANVSFGSWTAGTRGIKLYKNGSVFAFTGSGYDVRFFNNNSSTNALGAIYTVTLNLAVGDYIEVYCYQDSGVTKTLSGYLQAQYLGA